MISLRLCVLITNKYLFKRLFDVHQVLVLGQVLLHVIGCLVQLALDSVDPLLECVHLDLISFFNV